MAGLRISRSDLDRAVERALLSASQGNELWSLWAAQTAAHDVAPRFTITHILYYLGGMIAIGAMSLFMNLGWERFGPWALCAIAVTYAIGCILAARSLARRGLALPAGILATLAIVLVPLATWALQSAFGWWQPGGAAEHYRAYHTHVDWRWITLEFVTLVAAVIGLWRLRYPFMVMPLAVTLWYMSMDLARMIVFADRPGWNEWQYYRDFLLVFGLGMLAVAVWVDFRARRSYAEGRDFAFWLYLFGALTFWSGLTMQQTPSTWVADLYGMINVPTIVWIDERGRIVRPNDAQFGTDTFTAFHGKHSAPFLAAVRAWVREGRGALDESDARAQQRLPSPEDQLARAHFTLAWHLHQRGRVEAAERHFLRAGELSPGDWTIRRGSMPIRGLPPMGPAFFELAKEGVPRYATEALPLSADED